MDKENKKAVEQSIEALNQMDTPLLMVIGTALTCFTHQVQEVSREREDVPLRMILDGVLSSVIAAKIAVIVDERMEAKKSEEAESNQMQFNFSRN